MFRASQAVLKLESFEKAAQIIFHEAKTITGATSGYVALLSKDGTENDVLFLDPGGHTCTADPNLPMFIRGLRAEAYKSVQTVFHNDFANSKYANFLPEGHLLDTDKNSIDLF